MCKDTSGGGIGKRLSKTLNSLWLCFYKIILQAIGELIELYEGKKMNTTM